MAKEYMIVCAAATPDLVTAVNQKIKEGWQPLGGFTMDEDKFYHQPMIK